VDPQTDRFKQVFFEESAELLGIAEAGLLRLAPGAVDMDGVNEIFRAVHSIKGGGGAFGYSDLVAFAHEFESVMALVRSAELHVTADLVDVLIRSNDILAQLLAFARDEMPPPRSLWEDVLKELQAQAGRRQQPATDDAKTAPGRHSRTSAAQDVDVEPVEPPASAEPAGTGYAIHFRPKPELLLSGNEPIYMLRALARLGDLTVECDTRRVPPLEQLDPELLYLEWRCLLRTEASREAIEDVFEFVADDSMVDITPLPGDSLEAAPTPPTSGPPALRPRESDQTVSGPPGQSAGSAGGGGESQDRSLTSHTIRVDLEKIDRLVNMVGEMVITQAMVAEHTRTLPQGEHQDLVEGLEELAQHTRELRESVMSIRAQPVGSVFARMPRLVRDLSAATGKQVHLITSGEATEVDKTVIENLVDPLTHMLRNAIDHGLETPEQRRAAGKDETGTVHLSAQHRSGRIVIEITDDGRGIDRPRVLSKAIERGLLPPDAQPSDDEIDNLIFRPGFSTADSISNISGRGVGMDVVLRNISSLGGRIQVTSAPGEGARFTLSLPLTLAVLDGMVIAVGSERFVLPLTNIVESLRPKPNDINTVANSYDVIMARGEYVRLVHLYDLFDIRDAVTNVAEGLVVLVETEDGGRFGLVVDEIHGQQQVVIKSLESNFRHLDGVAAATILGDGRVALILDVAGLLDMSRGRLLSHARRLPAPAAAPANPSPALAGTT